MVKQKHPQMNVSVIDPNSPVKNHTIKGLLLAINCHKCDSLSFHKMISVILIVNLL